MTTSISDSSDNEYIASAGDDFHESALDGGDSISGGDELKDLHCVNLPSYLLEDVWNKDNFNINDV